MAKCLPTMLEALGSILNTTNKMTAKSYLHEAGFHPRTRQGSIHLSKHSGARHRELVVQGLPQLHG